MNYDRGDVVSVPFPFVTSEGASQKARPAMKDIDKRLEVSLYKGLEEN